MNPHSTTEPSRDDPPPDDAPTPARRDGDVIDELRMQLVMRRLFTPQRAPARLGRYAILEKLGEGGMGVVFSAFDTELDRKVAIKMVRVDRDASPQARRRVVREAKALARLSHPNIVQIHEVDEIDGQVFIAMEFIHGRTLSEWIRDDREAPRPRSWRELLAVFLPLARGLAAAHQRGLVHRDFKPGNVLIGAEDERPRLLDFGLARGVDGGADGEGSSERGEPAPPTDATGAPLSSLTATGAFVGTLGYMPPEQCLGEPVDARADQFGFCAALYEALFGVRPFPTTTRERYLDAIRAGELRAPAITRRVPRHVHAALARGLQADPEARFPDVDALARALSVDPWRRVAQVVAVAAPLLAIAYVIFALTRPGDVSANILIDPAYADQVEVTLDGAPLSRDMSAEGLIFTTRVRAGVHQLEATAPGHAKDREALQVARGGTHEVVLRPAREQGYLSVEVEPRGGEVLVDGVNEGDRPRRLAVPRGEHTVVARKLGFHDRRFTVPVELDQSTSRWVSLPPAQVWTRAQSGNTHPAIRTGDLDGDGRFDLLTHQHNDLRAFSPWTGEQLWALSLSGAAASQSVAVADVDGDGARDITVAHRLRDGAELVVWSGVPGPPDASGTVTPPVLWREPPLAPPTAHASDPSIADLDGDGALEVCTLGFEGATLTCREGKTGEPRWRTADTIVDGRVYPMRGALVVNNDRELAVHEPGDGAVRWRARLDEFPGISRTHRVDDRLRLLPDPATPTLGLVLNGDGVASRVVTFSLARKDSFRELASFELGGRVTCEALGDAYVLCQPVPREVSPNATRRACVINSVTAEQVCPSVRGSATTLRLRGVSDGLLVAARSEGELTLIDARRGEEIWSTPLATPTSPPQAFDWDADGRDDIALALADGTIVAYTRDGARLGSAWIDGRFKELRPVGDLDGDGFSELTTWGNASALVSAPSTIWERRSKDLIRVTPVVRDFDADGALEVAAFLHVGQFKGLHLLDARTGQVKRRPDAQSRDMLHTPVTVPREDGGFDLVTLTDDGLRRYALGERRPTITSADEELVGYTAPLLHDVDGDEQLDLLAGGYPRGLWFADPTTMALKPIARELAVQSLLVADIDRDGAEELIVTTRDGIELRALPSLEPRRSRALPGLVPRAPIEFVDLDGDGALELIITIAEPAAVLTLDVELRERWRSPDDLDPAAALAIPDPERPGRALVITPTRSHGVVALDATGQPRWRFTPEPTARATGFRSAPVYEDIYGDGAPVLLTPSNAGALYVLDPATGRPLARYGGGGDEPTGAAPVVVDLDGDGRREVLFIGADRGLRALRVAPRGARLHPSPW